MKLLGTLLSLLFPDFQIFEALADTAARAGGVDLLDFLKVTGFAFFYLGIYIILSWFAFSDKEF